MDSFFNSFFSGAYSSPEKFEADLDKYYCKHMEYYFQTLNNAKSVGYKVLRTKEGKHKVVKK